MRIAARLFSNIFHPLLMPTYGIILGLFYSTLIFYPTSLKLYLTGLVAICTLVMPALVILVLYLLKAISTIALEHRKERPVPYILTMLCYVFCGYLLYRLKIPLWIIGFIAGALLSLVTAFLITFKWKISAHATGVGGLVAASYFMISQFHLMPLWMFMLIILISGAVCSSRIRLGRHTLMQTICGLINGVFWISLMMP